MLMNGMKTIEHSIILIPRQMKMEYSNHVVVLKAFVSEYSIFIPTYIDTKYLGCKLLKIKASQSG